jgi:hypothetical protein
MGEPIVSYTYEAKAILLNKWRTMHYMQVAKVRREWREAGALSWLTNRQKFSTPVEIIVDHEVAKGRVPDVGSCAECVKAFIDGLVDAGMLPDDNPQYLAKLSYMAPRKTGRDAVTISVVEG